MDIEQIRGLCLRLRGVTESFPFDGETLVFKVQGKMFAVLPLERADCVVLKCAPSYALTLREQYAAVDEAYHFNKTHWNAVQLDSDINDTMLDFLICHAYGQALLGLTKKAQIAFFTETAGSDFHYEHLRVTETLMDYPFKRIRKTISPTLLVATADLQRTGRGQEGTSWEAENGKNLLLAYNIILNVPSSAAFTLNQATAVAVWKAVAAFLPPQERGKLTLKWPNDLYYGDKKLGGMLINTIITPSDITEATAGIGINVNQDYFYSDAPNPVSLRQVLGYDLPRFLLLETFVEMLQQQLAALQHEAIEEIRGTYAHCLYRREGFHPYEDGKGRFMARIAEVLPDGRLCLEDKMQTKRIYAFKEVKSIFC